MIILCMEKIDPPPPAGGRARRHRSSCPRLMIGAAQRNYAALLTRRSRAGIFQTTNYTNFQELSDKQPTIIIPQIIRDIYPNRKHGKIATKLLNLASNSVEHVHLYKRHDYKCMS